MVERITTDASVKAVKPIDGKQTEYPDDKAIGLALRVSATGKKSWTLRYRTRTGEQRRISLGTYPAVGLSVARDKRHAILAEVAAGTDPAKAQQAEKVAAKAKKLNTVADLIEDYFADAGKGRHKPNGRAKRVSTMTMERGYFERLIKPKLGKLPIGDLSRHDVQRLLDDVGSAAPSTARQCRNVIRQAYNYGIRREVVDKNPAQFAVVTASKSRERVITDKEMKAIWAAANDPASVDKLHLSAAVGLAVCFAALTLQRGGEVCGLHAREIDRVARLWTIPGARTKNHRTHAVPLSAPAMAVLDRAFGLAGDESGYAFPSPRLDASENSKPITRHALSRAMKRLTTKVGVADATPHDLRRTGATNITSEKIGISRFVVSRVLNQISDTGGAGATTAVYDRNAYLPEKRKALDAWALRLMEIVAGKTRPSNVVNLAPGSA